jgi:plasmid rolling circle replication initiator protein Rep
MFQNCNDSIDEKKSIVKQKKKEPKETVESFRKHKLMSGKLVPRYVEIFKFYNDDRFLRWSDRVSECGSYLEFYKWQTAGLKIKTANFCKDRLCPNCNWRRSLRMFAKLSRIVQSEQYKKTGYKNLFLTLTVRNCSINELHDSIKNIFYSFDKFLKNKAIKTAIKGYFRALEITYNSKTKTFHPHLHVILAVPSSYFSTYYYLSQEKLTYLWQQSLNSEYKPIVDIRKFKDKKGIAEASKYVIKSDDKFLKNIDNSALRILRLELANVRLVGFGGIFKTIAAELKLTVNEDIIENEIPIDDILIEILTLKWSVGLKNYELFKREKVGF